MEGHQPKIVYPYFLQCSSFSKDVFWKKIFVELAHGKPPHGVFFSRQTYLNCKVRGKMFSVNIIERQPWELFNDVVNLLQNRAGIMPISERIEASGHDTGSSVSIDNWSEIRKKTVRTQMFELFVLDAQRKYNLSWEQTAQILSLVQLYLSCKILSVKDIVYNDGRIYRIEGITLFDGGFRFERPFEGSLLEVGHKKKEIGRTFAELWKKSIR
jgi:hypothetical protein